MQWIYLSPHFDDIVLSCGGMVWEQTRTGEKGEAWTVCAGASAPGEAFSNFAMQLHERWETGPEAVPVRRAEDDEALKGLGAEPRYWDLPDCIYRRLPGGGWLVNGEEDLWRTVNPAEQPVVDRLSEWIQSGLAQKVARQDTILVSPLTLGNHVDHFLTRMAAEQAAKLAGIPLWYYPDYPYAVRVDTKWDGKLGEDFQQVCQPVTRAALHAWQEAIARYESQLSTFWSGRAELDTALEAYWQSGGGTCLWKLA
jgi:LmbE family N-acetylglucosaminyl deacetylase